MNISVIIPNYNHAKYLKQRIDSILNQSYQNFELIILDDHSTDSSKDIIETYKAHPKVAHIVYNDTNSGNTFKQWQKGVAMAANEYVWIAESDDYADKELLSEAVNALSGKNNTGLFFCNYYTVDESGEVIYEPVNIYTPSFTTYFTTYSNMDGRYFCEHYLFFSNLILNASAVVFKKDLFIKADESYQGLKLAGDWRMWVNIALDTFITFSPKKLNYFRTHTQNVRSAKTKLLGIETVLNQLYFLKKTANTDTISQLKNAICKTWVYSFSINKNLITNMSLIKNMVMADIFFPFRLIKRIVNNLTSEVSSNNMFVIP